MVDRWNGWIVLGEQSLPGRFGLGYRRRFSFQLSLECLWFIQGHGGCSKKHDRPYWCPQLWVCQSLDLTSFPVCVLRWGTACLFPLVPDHHLDSSIFQWWAYVLGDTSGWSDQGVIDFLEVHPYVTNCWYLEWAPHEEGFSGIQRLLGKLFVSRRWNLLSFVMCQPSMGVWIKW